MECRSPHGERGLKSGTSELSKDFVDTSLPAWGAWIEIAAPGPVI